MPCLFLFFALAITKANDLSRYDIPYIVSNGVVMVISFVLAYFFFQKKIQEAKKRRGLREKLTSYKKGLIITWSIISSTIFFSIACYIITGEHLFICMAIFTLVVLALNRPNIASLIEKLDLAKDEQRIIENPHSAI